RGVKLRLARLGRAVWDVVAIEDREGHSVRDELEAADPGNSSAERMLATLETEVPQNGPPRMNRTRCRDLGDGIFEFKEWGLRVLWFYNTGRRIVCTHSCPKLSKKEFQVEKARAQRLRTSYENAKSTGRLVEPEEPKKPKGPRT